MPRTEISLAFNTFAGLRHMLLLGMEDFSVSVCTYTASGVIVVVSFLAGL